MLFLNCGKYYIYNGTRAMYVCRDKEKYVFALPNNKQIKLTEKQASKLPKAES